MLNVLIVDDEPINQEILLDYLADGPQRRHVRVVDVPGRIADTQSVQRFGRCRCPVGRCGDTDSEKSDIKDES